MKRHSEADPSQDIAGRVTASLMGLRLASVEHGGPPLPG
jgi:hypothetical protein